MEKGWKIGRVEGAVNCIETGDSVRFCASHSTLLGAIRAFGVDSVHA